MMNITVYVFGVFKDGYSQLPHDHCQQIFQGSLGKEKTNTQIAIHREGDLVYYQYVRWLNSKQYIGLACVLNGVMITDIQQLFAIFEDLVADIVVHGVILEFANTGYITTNVSYLYDYTSEVKRIESLLQTRLNSINHVYKKLPEMDYSADKTLVRRFSLEDGNSAINSAAESYYNICVVKGDGNSADLLSSYSGKLRALNDQNQVLSRENKKLLMRIQDQKAELSTLNKEKKQTAIVSILAIIVVILFAVIYVRLINPSEVTHYETGEFIYYGPIRDKKPHGVGVAIYPEDDKDGRKYYIGKFVNGIRQDTSAMLFYRDGDYYYGTMEGDSWKKGMWYSNSDKSHFEGTFKMNKPYTGWWYDHRRAYKVSYGKSR